MFELPGYETLGKIGEGGMATVWKARHLTLDRVAALKVLTQGFSQDIELLERFRMEAQAAARINHPNVVAVFDAGEANGLPYYVMEYASGVTVADMIDEEGRIPEEQALRICLDMAKALKHVWDQHKIIHCDIKPENVIIDEDNTVKILDLGLARILDIAKHEMAESDMTVGTPNFMSPEAATGEVELDASSDIYSMGAMLYQMTTGTLPFYGLDAQSALEGQVNSYIDDPAKLVPSLSDSLPWLIEKMMVKKPGGRQRSWDEVISDIRAVLEGSMIDSTAAVDGASTVLRSSARKQPRRKRRMVVSKQSLRAGGDPTPLLPGRYQVKNDASRSLLLCMGLGALAGLLYIITYISY